MQYELRGLESMLAEKSPVDVRGEKPEMEQERIEQAFLGVLYSDRPKEKIEIYTRQHAKALLRLLKEAGGGKNKVHQRLEKVVQNLVLFLEKHADLYWDYGLIAPDFLRLSLLDAISAVWQDTRGRIERLPVHPSLSLLIVQGLEDLMQKELSLSYGQLILLRDLPGALSRHDFKTEPVRENDCRMVELLCRYNFNSPHFIELGKGEIAEREAAISEQPDSIFMLRQLKLFFDRIHPEPGYFYTAHQPAVSRQFSEYIQERLDQKNREIALSVSSPEPGSGFREERQIHTSISQELLCFIIRLFLDLQVIRSNNWKALARFVSAHFTTVRKHASGQADPNGISTCIYSPKLKTVMLAEDLLHRMLKKVLEWKNALKTTGKGPG